MLMRLCKHAAVQLSDDHKPNRTDERNRIEAAGGVVVWAGTWRVGGVLAVSRAFGDRLLKRYVVRACARSPPSLPMRCARCAGDAPCQPAWHGCCPESPLIL